jgi:hypothetical protein
MKRSERWTGLLAIGITLLFAGCSSPNTALLESERATPVATSVVYKGLVVGEASELALERGDLPPGFQLGGEDKSSEDGYTALYLRPSAFDLDREASDGLLGVTVNINIHPDLIRSQEQWAELEEITAERMVEEILQADVSASDVRIEEYDATLTNVDSLSAFRVGYGLDQIFLHEYRYRFRIANAVVAMVASARSTQRNEEPAGLEEQAHRLVIRQINRLNETRER